MQMISTKELCSRLAKLGESWLKYDEDTPLAAREARAQCSLDLALLAIRAVGEEDEDDGN